MKTVFFAVLGAAMLTANLAYAGDAQTPDANSATKAGDKIVCRSYPPPTGTLIGGRHVCRKASEWAGDEHRTADAIRRAQLGGLQGKDPRGGGN